MKEELRKAIELIKNTCDKDVMCKNCELYDWCSEQREKRPINWVNEKEWQVLECDINEKGYYRLEEGGPIPHFDYVQGLQVLMATHNLDPKDVTFGGWFYNGSCSWHKSLILKPEIPVKIRFYVKY